MKAVLLRARWAMGHSGRKRRPTTLHLGTEQTRYRIAFENLAGRSSLSSRGPVKPTSRKGGPSTWGPQQDGAFTSSGRHDRRGHKAKDVGAVAQVAEEVEPPAPGARVGGKTAA